MLFNYKEINVLNELDKTKNMNFYIKLVILAAVFFFVPQAKNAMAQTIVCPQGYAPTGGPDVQGCAPIPGFSGGYQEDSPNNKSKPKSYWKDSYGAIAFGKNANGETVIAYNKKIYSQKLADEEIFLICKALNYTDCKIALQFKNTYAVIVKDEIGEFYASTDSNRDNAAAAAMSACKAKNSKRCDLVGFLDNTATYVNF